MLTFFNPVANYCLIEASVWQNVEKLERGGNNNFIMWITHR
jgi:hypothetical protein